MFSNRADWGNKTLPFLEKVYFGEKVIPPIISPLCQ